MKKLLVALVVACPVLAADLEVGMRHVAMVTMGESGDLDVPLSRGFAATAEVFWTERVSAQFAASFVNPEAILEPEGAAPIDLGTLGIDVYSASARYHFAPQARFNLFAGGGVALVSMGNLDDQFGDEYEAELGSETAVLVEAGVRYRFRPRLFLDVSASYMPLSAKPEGRGAGLPATVELDPLTLSGGVAWRF